MVQSPSETPESVKKAIDGQSEDVKRLSADRDILMAHLHQVRERILNGAENNAFTEKAGKELGVRLNELEKRAAAIEQRIKEVNAQIESLRKSGATNSKALAEANRSILNARTEHDDIRTAMEQLDKEIATSFRHIELSDFGNIADRIRKMTRITRDDAILLNDNWQPGTKRSAEQSAKIVKQITEIMRHPGAVENPAEMQLTTVYQVNTGFLDRMAILQNMPQLNAEQAEELQFLRRIEMYMAQYALLQALINNTLSVAEDYARDAIPQEFRSAELEQRTMHILRFLERITPRFQLLQQLHYFGSSVEFYNANIARKQEILNKNPANATLAKAIKADIEMRNVLDRNFRALRERAIKELAAPFIITGPDGQQITYPPFQPNASLENLRTQIQAMERGIRDIFMQTTATRISRTGAPGITVYPHVPHAMYFQATFRRGNSLGQQLAKGAANGEVNYTNLEQLIRDDTAVAVRLREYMRNTFRLHRRLLILYATQGALFPEGESQKKLSALSPEERKLYRDLPFAEMGFDNLFFRQEGVTKLYVGTLLNEVMNIRESLSFLDGIAQNIDSLAASLDLVWRNAPHYARNAMTLLVGGGSFSVPIPGLGEVPLGFGWADALLKSEADKGRAEDARLLRNAAEELRSSSNELQKIRKDFEGRIKQLQQEILKEINNLRDASLQFSNARTVEDREKYRKTCIEIAGRLNEKYEQVIKIQEELDQRVTKALHFFSINWRAWNLSREVSASPQILAALGLIGTFGAIDMALMSIIRRSSPIRPSLGSIASLPFRTLGRGFLLQARPWQALWNSGRWLMGGQTPSAGSNLPGGSLPVVPNGPAAAPNATPSTSNTPTTAPASPTTPRGPSRGLSARQRTIVLRRVSEFQQANMPAITELGNHAKALQAAQAEVTRLQTLARQRALTAAEQTAQTSATAEVARLQQLDTGARLNLARQMLTAEFLNTNVMINGQRMSRGAALLRAHSLSSVVEKWRLLEQAGFSAEQIHMVARTGLAGNVDLALLRRMATGGLRPAPGVNRLPSGVTRGAVAGGLLATAYVGLEGYHLRQQLFEIANVMDHRRRLNEMLDRVFIGANGFTRDSNNRDLYTHTSGYQVNLSVIRNMSDAQLTQAIAEAGATGLNILAAVAAFLLRTSRLGVASFIVFPIVDNARTVLEISRNSNVRQFLNDIPYQLLTFVLPSDLLGIDSATAYEQARTLAHASRGILGSTKFEDNSPEAHVAKCKILFAELSREILSITPQWFDAGNRSFFQWTEREMFFIVSDFDHELHLTRNEGGIQERFPRMIRGRARAILCDAMRTSYSRINNRIQLLEKQNDATHETELQQLRTQRDLLGNQHYVNGRTVGEVAELNIRFDQEYRNTAAGIRLVISEVQSGPGTKLAHFEANQPAPHPHAREVEAGGHSMLLVRGAVVTRRDGTAQYVLGEDDRFGNTSVRIAFLGGRWYVQDRTDPNHPRWKHVAEGVPRGRNNINSGILRQRISIVDDLAALERRLLSDQAAENFEDPAKTLTRTALTAESIQKQIHGGILNPALRTMFYGNETDAPIVLTYEDWSSFEKQAQNQYGPDIDRERAQTMLDTIQELAIPLDSDTMDGRNPQLLQLRRGNYALGGVQYETIVATFVYCDADMQPTTYVQRAAVRAIGSEHFVVGAYESNALGHLSNARRNEERETIQSHLNVIRLQQEVVRNERNETMARRMTSAERLYAAAYSVDQMAFINQTQEGTTYAGAVLTPGGRRMFVITLRANGTIAFRTGTLTNDQTPSRTSEWAQRILNVDTSAERGTMFQLTPAEQKHAQELAKAIEASPVQEESAEGGPEVSAMLQTILDRTLTLSPLSIVERALANVNIPDPTLRTQAITELTTMYTLNGDTLRRQQSLIRAVQETSFGVGAAYHNFSTITENNIALLIGEIRGHFRQ